MNAVANHMRKLHDEYMMAKREASEASSDYVSALSRKTREEIREISKIRSAKIARAEKLGGKYLDFMIYHKRITLAKE